MASVGLGFGATLGASVLVFQHLGGQTGLIFLLPIYIYLFVVALGTDYNILMIARLREEAREGMPPAPGSRRRGQARRPDGRGGRPDPGRHLRLADAGRQHAPGPLGFAISFGIVVAAFVMAMFFTPGAHRPDRARGLVARPRRRTAGTRRATDPGGRALNRLARASEGGVKHHRPFGIETFDRTDGGITRTRPFGPTSALGAGLGGGSLLMARSLERGTSERAKKKKKEKKKKKKKKKKN